MTRDPNILLAAVNTLDVRNNPLFVPGRLLVPPELTPNTELALWHGNRYGVIPYTRCNGYFGVLMALLGVNVPWMTADAYYSWFHGESARALGWSQVGRSDAIDRSAGGFPVAAVAVDVPHGHIGAGVPSPSTDPATFYVTAAGLYSTARQRYDDQFGDLAPKGAFYTHD